VDLAAVAVAHLVVLAASVVAVKLAGTHLVAAQVL
jgi:hypothetical protein